MNATAPRLAALLLVALIAPSARAQWCYPAIPQNPDMCGPGYYAANCCGVYGPYHNVCPPYLPFQGMVLPPKPPAPPAAAAQGYPGGGAPAPFGPPPGCMQVPGMAGIAPPQGAPIFPTHPFARSPRDFFMAD